MGRLLPYAVSGLLLAGLALLVDWPQFLSLLAPHRLPGYGLAVGLYLLSLLLRAHRLAQLLSRVGGRRFPLPAAVHLAFVGTFANHLLPMRIGELAFVVLPRLTNGTAPGHGAVALVAARLHDVLAIALMTMAALPFIGIALPLWFRLCLAVAAFAVLALALRFGLLLALARWTVRRSLPLLPARARAFAGRLPAALESLDEGARALQSPQAVAGLLLNSIAMWAATFGYFYCLLAAFGMPLPYPSVVVGSLGQSIVQFLPINAFGNFGTFEAGWMAGFVALGLPVEDAAASGLAAHLITILVSGLLAALSLTQISPLVWQGWKEWRAQAGKS